MAKMNSFIPLHLTSKLARLHILLPQILLPQVLLPQILSQWQRIKRALFVTNIAQFCTDRFNHQFCVATGKISNRITNREWPNKFAIFQLPRAQMFHKIFSTLVMFLRKISAVLVSLLSISHPHPTLLTEGFGVNKCPKILT